MELWENIFNWYHYMLGILGIIQNGPLQPDLPMNRWGRVESLVSHESFTPIRYGLMGTRWTFSWKKWMRLCSWWSWVVSWWNHGAKAGNKIIERTMCARWNECTIVHSLPFFGPFETLVANGHRSMVWANPTYPTHGTIQLGPIPSLYIFFQVI